YFLLYLKQLSGKLKPGDPGWDVPWVVMDQSPMAYGVSFVTLTGLPCVSIILLTYRSLLWLSKNDWGRTEGTLSLVERICGLAAALIAVGYLAISSWRHRPQVSPEPPPCPAPLFE